MATYYVEPAPAGNDGNPGTFALPWATFQHAADTATAGDTVYFKDGAYTLGNGDDVDTNSGASGSEITFAALNSQQAVLNYDATANQKWYINAVDYINFVGLVLDGGDGSSGTDCVRIANGCTHITFTDCIIRDTLGYAVRILTGGTANNNITFSGTTIAPNHAAAPSDGRDCIYIVGATDIEITGCIFHDSDHVGVNMRDALRVVVEESEFYDNFTHCVGIRMNCQDVIVRHNVIRGGGTEGTGIYLEDSGQERVYIYRNEIRDTQRSGIYIRDDPTGPIYIWNNTFYGCCADGTLDYGTVRAYTPTAGTSPIVQFLGNIIYSAAGEYAIQVRPGQPTANWEFNYNCFYAAGNQRVEWLGTTYTTFAAYKAAAVSNEADSLAQQNPLFTNLAGDDYTLTALSPCIDAGTYIGAMVGYITYEGPAPDMGAYEFAAAPEPPAETTAGVVILPEAPSISPRMESKELSAHLYKPAIGSYDPRGTLVLDNIAQLWTSYTHTIKRVGGYWGATITQRGSLDEIEDWIFRLGYHFECYNPALEEIWEGFVNQITLQIGGAQVVRGPLLDVANNTYLVYSTVDTTTDPPTVGVRATAGPEQSAASQAKYGILTKYASAGGVSAAAVADLLAVYTAENAWPSTSKRWSTRQSVTPTATVELLGYVHWLKTFVHNDTTTGTRTLPLKIQDALGSDPNGLFSTDYSQIDPDGLNTQTDKRYTNDDATAWAQIKKVVAQGDGTDPWSFGIYNGRRAYYNIAPDEWEYEQALLDPAQRIFQYGGPEVAPWDVEAGKLMLATDFLVGKTLPAAPREDDRTTFIEQVSFIYPYDVDIVGEKYGTLAQRLATLGLAGVG